jgi:hypothetical protein
MGAPIMIGRDRPKAEIRLSFSRCQCSVGATIIQLAYSALALHCDKRVCTTLVPKKVKSSRMYRMRTSPKDGCAAALPFYLAQTHCWLIIGVHHEVAVSRAGSASSRNVPDPKIERPTDAIVV